MTQEQVVEILEKKGFREVRRLSFGDIVLVKRQGAGGTLQAQVDEDGDVNGTGIDDYLRSINYQAFGNLWGSQRGKTAGMDKTFAAQEIVKIAKLLTADEFLDKAIDKADNEINELEMDFDGLITRQKTLLDRLIKTRMDYKTLFSDFLKLTRRSEKIEDKLAWECSSGKDAKQVKGVMEGITGRIAEIDDLHDEVNRVSFDF